MKTLFRKLPLLCAALFAAIVITSCTDSGGSPVPTTPGNTTNNEEKPKDTPPVIYLTTEFDGAMAGFALAGSGTATIDWGDGSAEQNVELKTLTLDTYGQMGALHYVLHTYAEGSGKKTIKVTGNITGMDSGNTASVTAIDVTAMPTLKYIDLYDEKLSTLDVTKNTALTWLRCPFNAIRTLDVSKNTALARLNCQNNAIARLNVTNNVALTELYCANNAIRTLDVSKNTALVELSCSDNALTTLDVSNMLFLKLVACHENRLTSIDVRGCTSLEVLGCNWNKLSSDELKTIFAALSDRKGKTPAGRVLCSAADQPEAPTPLYRNPGWASLTDSDKQVVVDKNWGIE